MRVIFDVDIDERRDTVFAFSPGKCIAIINKERERERERISIKLTTTVGGSRGRYLMYSSV